MNLGRAGGIRHPAPAAGGVQALPYSCGKLALLGITLATQALSLGLDPRHGSVFVRMELRQDRLSRELRHGQSHFFREGLSGTLSLGASF